jgi:hypothetical protein
MREYYPPLTDSIFLAIILPNPWYSEKNGTLKLGKI